MDVTECKFFLNHSIFIMKPVLSSNRHMYCDAILRFQRKKKTAMNNIFINFNKRKYKLSYMCPYLY
jgi:hypothetical protein